MDDIWAIIGLSSLIASVVTVILGIVRDILVEKYRFKRQSEAGYVQGQIQLYHRIYFFLKRTEIGGHPDFFNKWEDDVKEVNSILKSKSSFLEPRFLNKWLTFFSLLNDLVKEKDKMKKKVLWNKVADAYPELLSIVKEIMNNTLIPKYRKIVGETVPTLD